MTTGNLTSRLTEDMFEDTQFMTRKEKFLVIKDFEKFIKSGFKEKNFTKRLYNHLHLHGVFIPRCGKWEFYHTYFDSDTNTEDFFRRLVGHDHSRQDHKLLNKAIQEMAKHYGLGQL